MQFASPCDPRTRRFVTPSRLVWQTVGECAPLNVALLLQAASGQATYPPPPCCTLPPGAGLLLDFGRELAGGLRLVTGAPADQRPVPLRVRFGESVSEAMGEPNNDHAIHDHLCRLPWCGQHEVGNTGFRFVRLDVPADGRPVELAAVQAVSLMLELPRQGAFTCSDPRLNQIWDTAADTVQLCMQDFIWDGVKRDRLVWLGDLFPEQRVISTVFGAHDSVPRSLDHIRDVTPLPRWMNTISTYSLWWILVHRDWYLYHGHADYVREQRDYLRPLLECLLGYVKTDGGLAEIGASFLDHPSALRPDAVRAGVHALLVMALESGAELCDLTADADLAARCRAGARQLRRTVPPVDPTSKSASCLLALSGLVDPVTVNRECLAREPLTGVTTFFGYFMLQARAAAGDYDGALEVIRNYWGGMLDLGATSFWEDFDMAWLDNAARIDELVPEGRVDVHRDRGNFCYKGWRHSLCHGWAGGPAAWLTEHVLGLRPAAPGCAAVSVTPHLGGLTFAEGVLPTVHGPVRVRHVRQADGSVQSEVQAPADVRVVRA